MREFLKRHTLWVGFAAVLLPLLVLLGLQFVWLSKLQEVSAIAHKATLTNYLGGVGTEVEYYYRTLGERTLNVPASFLTEGRLEEVASSWSRTPTEGARKLFLVDFTEEPFGRFRVYNPDKKRLESPPASDESLAIIVAATPWQMVSYRKGSAASPVLSVDERNPDYRIILSPITDQQFKVVGAAGMILDEPYFRQVVLPAAIKKALPSVFRDAMMDDLVVTVRDGRGGLVLAPTNGAGKEETVTSRLPFVFRDWTMGLHSPRSTSEQWARASFTFNVTLSALLAIALMGGIALALRAANRAMHLSEMKSDFVSNVSHELRTPLSSIRVFAELLRLGRVQSPEKVQEYGEYIEAEGRRLSRLIDNILDFSRIESGRKTYDLVPIDLLEVVRATVKTFEVRLKPEGFRLDFEEPADRLPPVTLDPDAIGQALHNLLDNAVKYSQTSKEIRVRVFREGDSALVSVTDHGIGIPKGEQRKIFERFHRVGTGLIHDVKGSGLGLSIVHHIVQAHRGHVTVDSEPGRGSTFTISLPVTSRAAPAAAENSGPALETGVRGPR